MSRATSAPIPVLLAALTVALAGCVDSATSDPPDATGAATGLISSVGPGGVLEAAANETAATLWVRDYWGEQTEIVVADATIRPDGGLTAAGMCVVACGGGGVPFRDGALIAPGTQQVDLTVTYTAPPTAPGASLRVYYGTSADGPAGSGNLTSGQTLSIPVTKDNTDAPFQKASLWWFWMIPVGEPGGAAFDLPVGVKVVAKRGPQLPTFPEASDYWGKATAKPLVDGPDRSNTLLYFMGDWFYCYPCQGSGWSAGKGRLVPEGSQRIEATVQWDWPGPAKPVLNFWNSDSVGVMTLVKDGASERTYEVAVPEDEFDSPYQSRSLWGFWTDWETNGSNSAVVAGSMTLKADVVRAPPST